MDAKKKTSLLSPEDAERIKELQIKYFGRFYIFIGLTIISFFITLGFLPFALATIGFGLISIRAYKDGKERGMADGVIDSEGKWVDFPNVSLIAAPSQKDIEKSESGSIDLFQNEKFLNLLKLVIDTPDMKLPLDQSTIEVLCDELKQDGIEISITRLQKKIEAGLVKYVVQEYVRVNLGNIVWPQGYEINESGLDGLYTLLEQKGIKISKWKLELEVNAEFIWQERERFKDSYFRFKPELREVKDIKQLIEGYVDIFGESYEKSLRYFEWFVKEHTGTSISQWELTKLIHDEINKRTNLSRAEAIRLAIKTGRVNQNHIKIEDIDDMDGIQFEYFLEKLFTAMGYKVDVTKASGDQGADLLAEKFGSRIAIQAKRYNGSVGNKAIQEVIGAMQYYGCDKGIVVTNSTFTKSAIALAEKSNVELIDRNKLKELIDQYGTIVAS